MGEYYFDDAPRLRYSLQSLQLNVVHRCDSQFAQDVALRQSESMDIWEAGWIDIRRIFHPSEYFCPSVLILFLFKRVLMRIVVLLDCESFSPFPFQPSPCQFIRAFKSIHHQFSISFLHSVFSVWNHSVEEHWFSDSHFDIFPMLRSLPQSVLRNCIYLFSRSFLVTITERLENKMCTAPTLRDGRTFKVFNESWIMHDS